MNYGFFLGEVIDIDKFKFIYGKNLRYKSMIEIKVKLIDKQEVIFRGYDEIADKIARSKLKFVFIYGYIRQGYIQIKEIQEI